MKTILCLSLLLFFVSTPLFAQGNLEPDTIPGPMMKTLDQVEPRTPISAAQTIAASGSYYLTKNISGTILITADNFDLDLNGFTLSNGNPNGVSLSSGRSGVRIFNGTIINPQSAGVAGPNVSYVHLHDLRMSGGTFCVNFIIPAEQVAVRRINCSETFKCGINLVAVSTTPLIAVVHDNIVSSTNTDETPPGASINIANDGTNEGTYADIRNNKVYGSELACMVAFSGANVAVSGGAVMGNSNSFCLRGLFVVGNFIVAQNFALQNEIEDYNFEDAPCAGWISFSCTASDSCSNVDFGIRINPDPQAQEVIFEDGFEGS